MLYQKRKSERPLDLVHVFLTRNLSDHKEMETQSRINRLLDLWEKGIH